MKRWADKYEPQEIISWGFLLSEAARYGVAALTQTLW
jgi:hypothetical protein